jgi:predicted alpha-1,6-mannanase (GH76 family)
MELPVKLVNSISTRILSGLAIGVFGLCMATPTYAQEAVASFNGYNSAFLVQNGQTFYAEAIGSTTTEREWSEALDIQVALDAYRHTHSAADRTLAVNLLNSLTYYNGPSGVYGYWIGDGWDDNLAWMANVYVQGYLLFGNSSYLTQAEAGWNNGYNEGWDTTYGGIWEERPNDTSKCMLSNGPFVWEGVQISLATGDTSYLTKAEQVYEWAKAHLVNTTSSNNSFGAPGQVNGCTEANGNLQGNSDNMYDNGIFLEAAAALYKATGSSEYSGDEVRTINHVMGEGSTIPYAGGESGHAWEYWVFRGMSDYATASNTWSTYNTYIADNANAAWNERNTEYNVTWNDWSNGTSLSSADPNEMSSAAAIWQDLVPPAVNLSGTWEIENVNSGLALDVSGSSKANKAAIVQEAFTSGNNAELFTFKATSGGYYQIINVNSGEAVNVSASSGESEALIDQWPGESTMNPGSDEWLPVVNTDGSYSFYNLNSYQALEVPGFNKTAGTQLDQYYGNGGTNQEFTLVAE